MSVEKKKYGCGGKKGGPVCGEGDYLCTACSWVKIRDEKCALESQLAAAQGMVAKERAWRKEYRGYLQRCGMILGRGEDHPEDIPAHVIDLKNEYDTARARLNEIIDAYERFKHLDKVLTDPLFVTGEISIDIKRDLWQAIKTASLSSPAEETDMSVKAQQHRSYFGAAARPDSPAEPLVPIETEKSIPIKIGTVTRKQFEDASHEIDFDDEFRESPAEEKRESCVWVLSRERNDRKSYKTSCGRMYTEFKKGFPRNKKCACGLPIEERTEEDRG